ncbi:flagellar motor switch protein FliM [Sphingomonas sp. IC-56]|uniref:flagellar motor switch protein FliM n=1 Tax=Sphingomonas sp. IC-56 TaxID=2898529 RepID=UPI001E534E4D|nr:flagellar motor switch protein FliM [Sphingomonas sp. IC-56]MCD2324218.1 flagellar motor switch protein FliM [Sphingomonas sp. IC-56]
MIDLDDFDLPDPPAAPFAADGEMKFDQADIDALFGDVGGPVEKKKGLRAVIESKVISQERLPMLEVVCDRVVRAFASSMRNLTSDAIDVSLEEVTSIRFGDFMNRIMLPAMVGVFQVKEWQNFGLITVNSSLIYSVVDALLGGRGGGAQPVVIDGRPFTTIETTLVSRMLELALSDFSEAFKPIEPVTMQLERVESNPRFAAIAGTSNICAVATFRVDMDGRGGEFSLLFPYATLEPVRHKLLQRFMGEKSGRDSIWEAHMASEIRKTNVTVDVVLGEKAMPLAELKALEVGQTIALHKSPDDPLDLACGGVKLAQTQIGQRRGKVAVRLISDVAKERMPA